MNIVMCIHICMQICRLSWRHTQTNTHTLSQNTHAHICTYRHELTRVNPQMKWSKATGWNVKLRATTHGATSRGIPANFSIICLVIFSNDRKPTEYVRTTVLQLWKYWKVARSQEVWSVCLSGHYIIFRIVSVWKMWFLSRYVEVWPSCNGSKHLRADGPLCIAVGCVEP